MKKWLLLIMLALCMLCAAAQAEVAVSPLGYAICYEPGLFRCAHVDGQDSLVWQAEDGTPVAAIHAVALTGLSVDDAVRTKTQVLAGRMDMTVAGSKQIKLFEVTPNAQAPERYQALAFVPLGEKGVLMFTLQGDTGRSNDLSGLLLNMLSTVETGALRTEYAQCDECGRFYPVGSIFRNHVCAEEWPVLRAADGTMLARCDRCGGWYAQGNEFRNHICVEAEAWTLDAESILGAWACAGAHDAYPYLVFYPDGRCSLYDYAPQRDEAAGHARPGALRQSLTYTLTDGRLALSCFARPLEVQAILAEEDMDTDAQLVCRGIRGLIMTDHVDTPDGLIPMEYIYFRMDTFPEADE